MTTGAEVVEKGRGLPQSINLGPGPLEDVVCVAECQTSGGTCATITQGPLTSVLGSLLSEFMLSVETSKNRLSGRGHSVTLSNEGGRRVSRAPGPTDRRLMARRCNHCNTRPVSRKSSQI